MCFNEGAMIGFIGIVGIPSRGWSEPEYAMSGGAMPTSSAPSSLEPLALEAEELDDPEALSDDGPLPTLLSSSASSSSS